MNDRIVLTRRQLGRAGSVLGGAALVITLALVIWQGGFTTASAAALIAGITGLALWVIAAPQDFRRWITGRTARYGGGGILSSLIVIAAAVAAYGWAAGRGIAVDMTLPQNYTLSPQTMDVVRRLDRPVQLTGFYSGAALPRLDRDNAVFHLFEVAAGDRFRVVYIDPNANPVLAERFGFQQDGSAFLTYVDPTTGEPDLTVIEPIDPSGAQERAVANALLRLMAAGQFRVYFTIGHGEPDPADATPDGLSGIFDGLAAQGILTDTLDAQTLIGAGVPTDATALLIAGARTRFTAEEVAALDLYLANGGRVFVAANAPLDPEDTFLDADDPLRAYLAERFGLMLHDDLVIDPGSSFQSAVNVVSGNVLPHPVTQRLGETMPVVFFGSRSMEVVPRDGEPPSMAAVDRTPILLTSAEAYGETDLAAVWAGEGYSRDDADLPGPLVLAALAADRATNARVMLTGDSDFLRNAPIGYLGNRFLYTDALAWLTEFFEQVEIDPVTDPTRLPILIPDEQMSAIFIVTVLVMPGIVLALGLAVWMRRSRR